MKECPNCKSIYEDDLFFCLQDGAALKKLSQRPTAPDPSSLATEVWPARQSQPMVSRSVFPYLVISFLLLVCLGLASVILVLNRDRLFGSSGNDLKPTNAEDPTPRPTTNAPENKPSPAAVSPTATPPRETRAPVANPTGRWKGDWSTKSGTLLDIEIDLFEMQENRLDGQIKWTLRKTVRPDKMDKVGLSAIEYVRGTYDPASGGVRMSGYRKDDPNDVLVMLDEYRLSVSADGKKLTGEARNGGRWNGYLNLARNK